MQYMKPLSLQRKFTSCQQHGDCSASLRAKAVQPKVHSN